MSLRFYLAGSAESEHSSNWRGTITDECWIDYNHELYTSFERNYRHAENLLIQPQALPGGFDYSGAYIFGKGHNLYGSWKAGNGAEALVPLHRQCLDLCDVLWVWLPQAGAGTWVEIGYAKGKGKPIILACPNPPVLADDFEDFDSLEEWQDVYIDDYTPFSLAFADAKKIIRADTAREAWDLFTANPIKYLDYGDYLKTEHWQSMRAAVFEAKGQMCQICKIGHDLHVHHLTYERVGRECLDDLVPLCARCHKLVHAKDGVR